MSPADLSADGLVNLEDLRLLRGRFGLATVPGEDGVLDVSGVIDLADEELLLEACAGSVGAGLPARRR